MPTSAIISLHLILCTNIFNGYSESPIDEKFLVIKEINGYLVDMILINSFRSGHLVKKATNDVQKV
jgi:hypothetical protein